VQAEVLRDALAGSLMPRTLLPFASNGGENTPSPNCPGSTAMMPPPTPLLAGMPTLKTQPPE
jgi:hypothetical protein